MFEMKQIDSIVELNSLDEESIMSGYCDGLKGKIDVLNINDDAYMLGVVNGASDRRGKPSSALNQSVVSDYYNELRTARTIRI
jgi:hypothetical protein